MKKNNENKIKIIKFLNIKFFNVNESNFKNIIKKKGLFVFPAAPPLATLKQGSLYHRSLIKSDLAFFDSGFFVLLLRFLKGIKVEKFSGYKFLNFFFSYIYSNKNIKILSIDPSKRASSVNKNYFKKLGVSKAYSYVAPFYNVNKILDYSLLNKIKKVKPNFIIINIGGGTQEILGLYIKKKIKFKTCILCTGAAISFFTKQQAPINNVIDKLYLGWLFRLLYNPNIFFKRYLSAFKLISFVKKGNIKIVK